MFRCITLLVLALLWLPGSQVLAGELALNDDWQYRWGDSPRTPDGELEWLTAAEGEWKSLEGIGNPPGRDGRDSLWLRRELPAGDWLQPALFVSSLNLVAEAYVDGQHVYRHGQLEGPDAGAFAGWTWHAIELPSPTQGKTLYLRLKSSYKDIGLWGKVVIMEQSRILPSILEATKGELVIALACLIVAALALVLILTQPERWRLGSLGLFSLAVGLMVLAESDASQLIVFAPLAWDYVAAIAYFSLPVSMALILEHWFPQIPRQGMRRLWLGLLAYAIIAPALAMLDVVSLPPTFPLFDLILLGALAYMARWLFRYRREFDSDQRLIVASYAIFAAIAITDMLVAHGLVGWISVPVHLGALAFIVAMIVISTRHYARSQRQLQRLNDHLEQEVAERTRQLESLAEQERQRALVLATEHHKTQRLASLIDTLQACTSLEEALCLTQRAMPEILEPMQGAFYRPQDQPDNMTLELFWPTTYRPPAWLDTTAIPPLRTRTEESLPALDDLLTISTRRPPSDPSAPSPADNLPHWIFPLDLTGPDRQHRRLGVICVVPDGPLVKRPQYWDRTRSFIELGVSRLALVLSSIALQEELSALSYRDDLTGLHNRRYFDELFAHETAISLRKKSPLAVVILDIDHFKKFNDRYGHAAGDTVLEGVGRMLANSFRDIDVVCRFGGEEFVVLLPGAEADDAHHRMQRMCHALASASFRHEGQSLGTVSVSCGIASFPATSDDPSCLLAMADSALYRAKHAGRARIALATPHEND
ncbi:diguanylate cyclase [Halomonas sp. OfavH-34-E]|uniref:sensor domain-containing diguanylate cyclase n=1 Tax=Halomonas sp. OfavH-34-E TaxID=2954491 RepID=UPI002097FB5C|nr:diguanylate cyclase [Halomonas sp. OfavH-34-E]MCO7215047.1 diguanylate cyclase [Halomonas sp. OfavH-34-E]